MSLQALVSLFVLLVGLPVLPQGSPLKTKDISEGPIVNLGYAQYEGTALSAGINQFLGIRYAAPPVGDLRFRAPRDPLHQDGIQDAKEFAPTCIGTSGTLSDSVNEDCLYVDVFAPSDATAESKLPVWFFIQGGGYAANSDQNFNGTEVITRSNHSLIFVQINYRVGAFGFLASEKIKRDGDLNVGLLDQSKALKWARKYIHLFGGDPDHIVIHGDSAGGGSIAYHLTAYGGGRERTFIGAISESPFLPTHRTVADSEIQFDRFVQDSNCSSASDVMNCLRSQELTTLQAADVKSRFPNTTQIPLWYFLPVVDGSFSPDLLYNLFEQGRLTKVPVIVGNDNDEGTGFTPNVSTSTGFLDFIQANYPKLTPADLNLINRTYPLKEPFMPKHAPYFTPAQQAYGEATFTCPGIEIASSMAIHNSHLKSWSYRYNVLDTAKQAAGLGVSHVSEKPAIVGPGNAGSCTGCSYYTYNAPMVPIVMDYWISFILTLNPNTHRNPAAPEWKPWGSSGDQRLKFQLNQTAMERVPDEQFHRCSVWKHLSSITEQK